MSVVQEGMKEEKEKEEENRKKNSPQVIPHT